MDNFQQESPFTSIPIPGEFYSDATGAPFERCLRCEKPLLVPGTEYFIEKAIRRYEKFDADDTIFEYAMCVDCHIALQDTFSEESRKRLDAYFQQHAHMLEHHEKALRAGGTQIDAFISNCLIKKTSREASTEYQIYAHCDGDRMLLTVFPFMLSGEAIDEMVDLLSDKTIGEIGGLMDEFFDLPPDLKKKLPDRPILLV